MRLIFAILIITFSISPLYSQNSLDEVEEFDPSILILYPYHVQVGFSLISEINEENEYIEKERETSINSTKEHIESSKERQKNIRIMLEKKLEFQQKKDFYSRLPETLEGFLQYTLFERFNNLLIYAINQKSPSEIDSLSNIANKYRTQYIINFPKVNIYEENGVIRSDIKIQLFDNISKQIVLDKEYTGDFKNPGFEFTCRDSSIGCTFNNAIAQSIREILYIISTNSPSIVKAKILNESRTDILYKEYFIKNAPKEVISIINSDEEIEIDSSAYFQSVFNDGKDKFISFFAVESNGRTLEQLKGTKDKHVNIVMEDFNSIDKLPGIYAYTVEGLKYENKWYFLKGNITYFNSNDFENGKFQYFSNLIKWSFFKESSTEVNKEYWESNTFRKVESSVDKNKLEIENYKRLLDNGNLTSEKKDFYKYMIDRYYGEDLKNKKYFGMYELVVSRLEDKIKSNNNELDSILKEEKIIPFLNEYIGSNNDFISFDNDIPALIYPLNREMILFPVLIEETNGKSQIHFFLLKEKSNNGIKFYEWNYFDPFTPKNKNILTVNIVDKLKEITFWNYSFNYYDNKEFWDNYVLLKSNDEFEYLKSIDF